MCSSYSEPTYFKASIRGIYKHPGTDCQIGKEIAINKDAQTVFQQTFTYINFHLSNMARFARQVESDPALPAMYQNAPALVRQKKNSRGE